MAGAITWPQGRPSQRWGSIIWTIEVLSQKTPVFNYIVEHVGEMREPLLDQPAIA